MYVCTESQTECETKKVTGGDGTTLCTLEWPGVEWSVIVPECILRYKIVGLVSRCFEPTQPLGII